MSILNYFPRGFLPRDVQIEALRRVDAAYRGGAEYVVLEAPPGTGKSHIAMTLAAAYGRTYITTLTEQLQTQYINTFSSGFDIKPLKGRGKFQCERAKDTCRIGKLKYNCDELPSSVEFNGEEFIWPGCPYLLAKRAAFDAQITVANYHSFISNVWQADKYEAERLGIKREEDDHEDYDDYNHRIAGTGHRNFLVCDEAHAIENFLMDHIGSTVSRKRLAELEIETPDLPLGGELFDIGQYVDWIQAVLPIIANELARPDGEAESHDELQNLIKKLSFIAREVTDRPDEFIVERDERDGVIDENKFALKPLRVARYGRMIFRHAARPLLMSATVLNYETLVRNIGLEPAAGAFVQMDSVFPVKNRPIKVYPMNMTMPAREKIWPIMTEMVDEILKQHSHQKGLLLCPSNEMLYFIKKYISADNAARLIFAFGEKRAQQYEMHLSSSKPTVLAASGYWEGADLKDDSSRFQIIPAVPRALWKGQVKARGMLEPEWYRWLCYTKIVQGYGRSIRSETDSAVTYLFDAKFVEEMESADSMLPPWVQAAVTIEECE